jgi:hypothetical protein
LFGYLILIIPALIPLSKPKDFVIVEKLAEGKYKIEFSAANQFEREEEISGDEAEITKVIKEHGLGNSMFAK